VPNTIKSLVSDYREIMYPYTSMGLRESEKTTMKDYLKAAGYY
jgi:ribosome biogenesis protein SSF1/2